MKNNNLRSRGFTLIAALLLLILMSGMAIGLLMMVNTEQRAGGNDVENSLAYRGAEAGIESMTSSVAATFNTIQAPSATAIDTMTLVQPTVPGITFTGYSITSHKKLDASGNLVLDTQTGPITGGPNAGLYATLIRADLDVTGQRPLGEQVRMLRTVEIALIPVFQFGVFSDSDLDFFAGPNFDFGGRIHTNGNLFLAEGSGKTLTMHDKISVLGEVYRQELANGFISDTTYTGTVLIPNTSNGCPAFQTTAIAGCRAMAMTEASQILSGTNFVPNNSGASKWPTSTGISLGSTNYNGWIINGSTGAKRLSLPFVQGTTTPIEIIRRPPLPLGTSDTAVGPSRLYNLAQIRVMISNTAAENHPDGSAVDADDVTLDNVGPYAVGTGVTVGGVAQNYFAHGKPYNFPTAPTVNPLCANQLIAGNGPCDADFLPTLGQDQPLIGGVLRVEVKYADDSWHPVTREWLGLGFARGLLPPDSGGPGNNAVHPTAILIFQQQADRNASSTITNGLVSGTVYESTAIAGNNTQYNWFPINLYDTREGEVRDNDPGLTGATGATCAVNGIMNLVELDVYNLKRWLAGTTGTTGTSVDKVKQNGYVLYFSDRRGMLPDPNSATLGLAANVITGEYGFEDTINASSAAGTVDDINDPDNGEDVDGNGVKDNWGAADVGTGFGVVTSAIPRDPYQRVTCMTTARKNRVTGARHGLRLVNGSYNGGVVNLPLNPLATPSAGGTSGGFTVASENPIYILGDYNANGAWTDPHAAGSVIADSVTLLSNNWGVWDAGSAGPPVIPPQNGDIRSFYYPTTQTSRNATETWYRLAIAAGKNKIFAQPAFAAAAGLRDYGTDGGMHNFLRYLEDWGGVQAHYEGSLVSLFYSQYGTGVFKCCTTVYNAPDRKYAFDTLFLDPANLPPGTPMFKDVNNLTYRQDFTPH
jgi:hypothetical protein